jgi:hypothetical protein
MTNLNIALETMRRTAIAESTRRNRDSTDELLQRVGIVEIDLERPVGVRHVVLVIETVFDLCDNSNAFTKHTHSLSLSALLLSYPISIDIGRIAAALARRRAVATRGAGRHCARRRAIGIVGCAWQREVVAGWLWRLIQLQEREREREVMVCEGVVGVSN